MADSPQKYDPVIFEFVSAGDDPSTERGRVLLRADEMVLEVDWPGDRPYVIVGKKRLGGQYEGHHKGLPDDVAVTAKWTQLDDLWIGTWVEDGIEYLFTFKLPH